jgi:hypothetical protein
MSEFTFTDASGREWDVKMTMGAARRIDASDFSELTDKEFSILSPEKEWLFEVYANSPLMIAIVWAMAQPQAKEFGVDESAFLDGIDGATIEATREAFWRSLMDFFRDNQTGLSVLKKAMDKARKTLNEKMPEIGPEIESAFQAEISKAMTALQTELKKPSGVKSSE